MSRLRRSHSLKAVPQGRGTQAHGPCRIEIRKRAGRASPLRQTEAGTIKSKAHSQDWLCHKGWLCHPSLAGSPAHVFVQEGEHVGLPNIHAEMEEVVPI